MAAEDVVRSMRTRVPWTVAGQMLGSLGLDKSQGWRRTLDKVTSGNLDYDSSLTELSDALEEHLVCGEKIVRLFRVSNVQARRLRELVSRLEIPNNEFSEEFPTLLSEDRLRGYRGHPPYLAGKIEYRIGTAVVLASARYLLSREAMMPSELPNAAAAELDEYEEIICVKHQRLQAADVLWVPAEGEVIELRTDFPLGMHIRSGLAAADLAQARFSELVGVANFGNQINLFPAIEGLYHARGDGRMVELGFMVSGSSQKLEKTRRDAECCREEAYHLGGVGALRTPIAPFRASVLWPVELERNVTSAPEITLRGTPVQSAEPNAFLGEMVICNCTGLEDYEFVRDRVLARLPD